MSYMPPISSTDTAGRPTGMGIGFKSFDEDLGIPIWWNGADWIDATGAVV